MSAVATRILRNFVDGEHRDATSDESTPLINPATGEEFARAPVSSAADVDAALKAAQRAFGGWRDTTPKDRSMALLRIADAFEQRAEEFVAFQMASVLMGLAVGLTALVTHFGGPKLGVFLLLILPFAGFGGPALWLRRRVSTRRDTVTNDLPDVLDLMTISVAAGLGLEQAMQVTCAHFESPVCDELALTLREMELGLSRHDALENLKLRTDIDDLVTFSVVLSQADMLGLPIGRVLQAQGDEMRDKRRQRARERAAKVPIKILFPLMFCFLPAIMILILGPLIGPISHALK